MKKINIPEGHELVEKDGDYFIQPVENKLPMSWEELGAVHGYYIDSSSSVYHDFGSSYGDNKNIWPTQEEAKAALALSQLCQLRDAWNEGWKPDYNDSQEKHFFYFFDERPVRASSRNNREVLVFKSEELRDKFLETFRDLIEVAKPLL